MSKLVRDKIPDIIKASGKTPIYHQANSQEVDALLKEKLLEEVNELLLTNTAEDLLEEAADVFEVIRAMLYKKEYTTNDLIVKADEKRYERGAFAEGYILDEVK